MTVSPRRRHRATGLAATAALVGLVAAGVLGTIGGVAIYHTTDGEVQGAGAARDLLENTATGVIGVVGEGGSVGSLAVVVLSPAGPTPGSSTTADAGTADAAGIGAGGTVVPVPMTADVSGGFGDERRPLHAVLTADAASAAGSGSLAALAVGEVGSLLGVTIDDAALLTTSEFAELVAPLGPLDVDLPAAVNSIGLASGPQTLDGGTAASLLGADDPELSAAENAAVDVAVWRGIAASVGDGVGEPLGLPPGAQTSGLAGPAVPAAADQIAALSSGPVYVTRLHARPITDLALNPNGIAVSTLDTAEVVTLFAHVAPGRVAAPNAGLNVALRSPFSDDQLPDGITRYDVAYAATNLLLNADDNVLSADSGAGEATAPTTIEVAHADLVPAAETLAELFGPVDVRVAERRITGIDVVVTLGTDFLGSVVATSAPRGTPPPSADALSSVPSDTTTEVAA